jgi:hypothetical protein
VGCCGVGWGGVTVGWGQVLSYLVLRGHVYIMLVIIFHGVIMIAL